MALADDIRKHKDKGADLLAKGKLDPALASFREVLKLAPTDVNIRQKVAEVLHRLGRRDEAIHQYQQVAGKYAVEGMLLKAIAINKVILQLDARHTETQTALAELYAKQRGTATLPASMTAALRPPGAPSALHPTGNTTVRAMQAAGNPVLPDAEDRLVIHQDVHEDAPSSSNDVEQEISIDLEIAENSSSVDVDTTAMPHIPLFSQLSPEEFISVSERVQLRTITAGEHIVTEGEFGSSMFAIVQGSVDVVRRMEGGEDRVVAQMNEGAFFGEMALVALSPRLASVVAREDGFLLEFTRDKMKEIVDEHPSVGLVVEQFYRERLLANLLRSNAIFKHFTDEEKARITAEFRSHSVEPGEVLLTQGQRGNGFYLLLRGRCEVAHQNADGTEQRYPDMREGDVFGEISLLLNQPVSATVRASTTGLVLQLSRPLFEQLIIPNTQVRQMVMRLSSERLKRTQDLLAANEISSSWNV